MTGSSGGTFSINNSGVINSTTGLIDLSASGNGSFIITYITGGVCPDTATFNIVITNQYDLYIYLSGLIGGDIFVC